MLKSVLTGEQCAKCRICCSFVEEDVWEAPTLTDPVTKKKYRAEYKFKDKKEILLCPALDEKTGCTLGDDKPFECKIWPLRPFRKDGEIKIGVAKVCPAFGEKDDEALRRLLREGLYDVILREAEKNPEIVRQQDAGYRILENGFEKENA